MNRSGALICENEKVFLVCNKTRNCKRSNQEMLVSGRSERPSHNVFLMSLTHNSGICSKANIQYRFHVFIWDFHLPFLCLSLSANFGWMSGNKWWYSSVNNVLSFQSIEGMAFSSVQLENFSFSFIDQEKKLKIHVLLPFTVVLNIN
jgi:hypothetical protein